MKKLLLSLALLPFSTFLARAGLALTVLSGVAKLVLLPFKLLLLPLKAVAALASFVGWLGSGIVALAAGIVTLPFRLVALLVGGVWTLLAFVLTLPVKLVGGVLRVVTAPVRWVLPALALVAPAALAPLAVPAAVAQTAPPSAEEVFEEVERRQNLVESEEAAIRMEIVDERGRTRTRQMRTLTKVGSDDRTKSLVVFTGPADIRGMGLLTVERDGGDEQQLYLPALRRVQRIAGSQRGERFAGSDFTYEDLSTRDPDEYRVTLAATRPDAYVLEAVPENDDSLYGRIVLTVDRERYVVRRAEHYDRSGELAKVLTAEDFEAVGPEAYRARTLTMEDVREGRRTVLTYEERETGADLRDDLFTKRQLQRGLR